MKHCSYCGAEYPDYMSECPMDHKPLLSSDTPRSEVPQSQIASDDDEQKEREMLGIVSLMKLRAWRFWRSPALYWCLFALFVYLTVIWQLVDVVPYPNMYRDEIVGDIIVGVGMLASFLLACRSQRRKQKKDDA